MSRRNKSEPSSTVSMVVCDRCGCEVVYVNEYIDLRIKVFEKIDVNKDTRSVRELRYNLCDNCSSNFMSWLKSVK